MAEVRLTHKNREYLVSRDGIYRLTQLEEKKLDATDRGAIKLMKEMDKSILVELFIKDTSLRSHREVSYDLLISEQKVKMMRHQFKGEGRLPYSDRYVLLKEFYAPELMQ